MEVARLLTQRNRQPKIDKNMKVQVDGRVLHLAPAKDSGYEVCAMRSPGCTVACLNKAGFHYKGIRNKHTARINRTKMFFEDRMLFMDRLAQEIYNSERYAKKNDMICGIRLNGTSDIPWESVGYRGYKNVMEVFPDVKFYDYTKRYNGMHLPVNYRLTFSRSEDNGKHCRTAMENGMNVAVVFRGDLPRFIDDVRVIDGDAHDWRYGDYDNYPNERIIIGLKAKGLDAKNDTSGFVVDRSLYERKAA